MKNLLRGSLLAVMFVGMSGFSVNYENSEAIKSQIHNMEYTDPGGLAFSCDEEAHYAAELVKRVYPAISEQTYHSIFLDVYLSCNEYRRQAPIPNSTLRKN